jgi:starch synthase
LYALRYGTIPIVRNVGGLRDTVKDMGDWQGTGIRFDNATVQDIVYSVGRAIDLYYHNEKLYKWMRSFSMTMDFSWDKSSKEYIDLYKSLK